MAHECSEMTADQREMVLIARDLFFALSQTHQGQPIAEWQANRCDNRVMCVAVIQDINGLLENSDVIGECVRPADGGASEKTFQEGKK